MKVFNSKGEFEYPNKETGERTVCSPHIVARLVMADSISVNW